MTILVTGGAGFIGSNFILHWLQHSQEPVINVDKLTYAANLTPLNVLNSDKRYVFAQGDIGDSDFISQLLKSHQIRAVIHFAAETHVDRSIQSPTPFIQTNIEGTFQLLESSLQYFRELTSEQQNTFRFLHISTDEVYGALHKNERPFVETDPYCPSSPYAASKAASDHLVSAYHHTYGLPVLITNCSNNYGPHQYPEKLMPLCIQKALSHQFIPIYGDGSQIRDWLYVTDHCEAIQCVLHKGKIGEKYHIGGMSELTNLEVVNTICNLLDYYVPRQDKQSYLQQITHVADRAGHDFRYAIDITKIRTQLQWTPKEPFTPGIAKTIEWYLNHMPWTSAATSCGTAVC